MRPPLRIRAPAKVNLTLHVVGRRDDGYHLLDSVVVFADVADTVEIRPAAAPALEITGPFAREVPHGGENLALRAAAAAALPVHVMLDKALPAGAGLGGGSADAAAVLRGIAALTGRPMSEPVRLGADVPVCLFGRPARMRGVGEDLRPLAHVPAMPIVLVYPGVPVSTRHVFQRLEAVDGAPMPDEVPAWTGVADAARWLAGQRNDLERAAAALAPPIAAAMDALRRAPGCCLARMSGSGSTVFGLFGSDETARGAAARLQAENPGWWVRATHTLTSAPVVQERRLTT